jgi:hypothetical protein
MGISRILWHIPERLIHLHVRIAGALLERVPSYGAKRLVYFFLYAPYIANYILTVFKIRHTTASVSRERAALPVIHISGPFFARKKDDIFLYDMMRGVERKFEFFVIGKKPVVSSECTPAVGLSVGKVKVISKSTSSFTVSMLPKDVTGSTTVKVSIKSGRERVVAFRIRSVREAAGIRKASVNRLKNGARFAFIWRLDWDHATSPAMLREFFSLAQKWGIPPTIYASGAVLDEKLYAAFMEKSGGKYAIHDMRSGMFGYSAIPSIREMRESKKLLARYRFSSEIEFPTSRFTAEIGNHMHHHFGGPENGWEPLPQDPGLIERDLMKNHMLIKKTLKTEPRTWSRPTSGRYPTDFISALERHGYDSVCNFEHSMGPLNSPCLGVRRFGGVSEMFSNYPRDPYFGSDVTALESALSCCSEAKGINSHMVLSSHLGPPFFFRTKDMLERLFTVALEGPSWACTASSFTTYASNAGRLDVHAGERKVMVKNPTGVLLQSVPLQITYGKGYVDMVTVDCPAKKSVELKL